MDARLRSSLYEEAHGSPLYTAPRKNINPSTSGDRIQEEISVRKQSQLARTASYLSAVLVAGGDEVGEPAVGRRGIQRAARD